MTAALTETVSGRTIPRYRGEPVTHDIRFTPATPPDPGYRLGGTVAQGPGGFRTILDGGPTDARLAAFPRWHKTGEPRTQFARPRVAARNGRRGPPPLHAGAAP